MTNSIKCVGTTGETFVEKEVGSLMSFTQ